MRPELRWLVMTILIVGVLLAISALALDRPDVIWTTKGPECPACRTPVASFAYKCKDCDESFISSSKLRYHMDTAHDRELFECRVCKKAFLNKANFQINCRNKIKGNIHCFFSSKESSTL